MRKEKVDPLLFAAPTAVPPAIASKGDAAYTAFMLSEWSSIGGPSTPLKFDLCHV